MLGANNHPFLEADPTCLTAVFQPYKVPVYNIIDVLLLGSAVLAIIFGTVQTGDDRRTPNLSKVVQGLITIFIAIPVVYFVGLTFKLFINVRCVQEACRKLWASIPCQRYRPLNRADSEDSVPDRMAHPERYVVLLAESANGT